MRSGNYILNQLSLQQSIAKQQLRIDQSGYLPDIALFGKQTLYAHGIQSNLVPRTIVGVGFTWNLFRRIGKGRNVSASRKLPSKLLLWEKIRHKMTFQ